MRIYALFLVIVLFGSHPIATARHRPSAPSSTLLRMHRLYLRQPPHDTSLYDTLQVSPNATAAEITKSYRKLSRRLHPDKTGSCPKSQEQLERVRAAYEVLHEDRTRLRYHRHGLLDAKDAVSILTGRRRLSREENNDDMHELLQLMGYYYTNDNDEQHHTATSSERIRHNRVVYIATSLVQILQPVLDGRLSRAALRDTWHTKCDRLKRLPLGAQILRCIGRAYRAAGQRVLQKQHSLLYPVKDVVRQARHMATAAVAGGRVLLEEHKAGKVGGGGNDDWTDRIGEEQQRGTTHADTCFWDEDDAASCEAPTEQELQRRAQEKVDAALLESLQIEALWKICKIELDRTVRKACELVLSRQLPSAGWVSERNGVAVPASTYQARLASLLVLLGDTLVMRSKEGTSWLE